MRWWKPALGGVIVLAIAVWDVGLPSAHSSDGEVAKPRQSNHADSPSSAARASGLAKAPGLLSPKNAPEFSATFTGSTLNASIWSTCYPWLDQSGCTNFDNAKVEDEWYLPSQVKVSGGVLHLVARRELTQGKTSSGRAKTYACRSGMVTSYPGFRFKYGYIQVVARIPTGAGLWPALWLAAANLQWPPEMDILEAWGGSQFFASTYFHYATASGNAQIRGLITPALSASGWHIFGLSWTKTQMTWLLDGRVIMVIRQHVPHQEMYFIADLAEAVSKHQPHVTPGECSGSLLIRSVKVWKE